MDDTGFEITYGQTDRGFARGDFVDRYHQKCSIQDSSLAAEAAVWLGVDFGIPKKPGEEGKEKIHNRMHLTQDMARELAAVLLHFAEHGTITSPSTERS